MNAVALVLGLVATTVTIVLTLGTLMKWLLDTQAVGVNQRLEAVEADLHLVKSHLLGATADR